MVGCVMPGGKRRDRVRGNIDWTKPLTTKGQTLTTKGTSPVSEETRKATFGGSDGANLSALLELPRGTPRAYALFAHCFSCSKDIKAAREIARTLRADGFAVLRFDFTGLGMSEGEFANTNFSSNVEDLVRAAGFLRDEFEAPSILIGHSLGGAAAIVAAHDIPEVKGVAVIGAPAEAAHVLAHIGEERAEIEARGEATVKLAGRPFTIRKQFLDDLENARVTDAVATLKKPFLVMHAPLDETVGIENATKLFVQAKHPKSFVSLDTADHLLSRNDDARYAARVLAAWAGRFIDGGPAAPAVEPPATQSAATHPDDLYMRGGAHARSIDGRALGVALSVDGHAMTIDAGADEGGDDLGPNPTRTVEGALAACAVMTMALYARRKNWPLAGSDVVVRRAPGADAHTARTLEKTITLRGDLDASQQARLREIADKCPVHRMLAEEVTIISRDG